jgi:hypothetical protein
MDNIEPFGDVQHISHPATRDIYFGMSDIVFAGDYVPGELQRLCDYGRLDIRVYDRSALPEDEVKLYIPRPPKAPKVNYPQGLVN